MLNVSEDTWSRSLFSPDARLVEAAPAAATASTATVSVRTLDSLREEILQPNDRAFLKIDTQGYEHEVLADASALGARRSPRSPRQELSPRRFEDLEAAGPG